MILTIIFILLFAIKWTFIDSRSQSWLMIKSIYIAWYNKVVDWVALLIQIISSLPS